MKRLSEILLLLFITVTRIYSQTDNLFWFAAPDVSSQHGDPPRNGAPIYFHITAVQPTTVRIERPADPSFTPVEFNLNAMEHRSIRVDNSAGTGLLPIDQIEVYPQPWPLPPGNEIQKKGFKITAYPGAVTVYYELDQYWNRDIFALKGRNAMGKRFYVSTQNFFPNGDYGGTAWSGFVICATQNNTTITIWRNDEWLYFTGVPPTPTPITITLNEGETFAFRARYTAASRHINGVLVESDKDIVITVYDDSMRKKYTNNTSCNSQLSYDIFGDQTIPIDLIGYEYIVMKGLVTNAQSCDGDERFFITATENNTVIYINGVYRTTINAGQVYSEQVTQSAMHIRATKKVYVNHTTGYGGELGGAVLPTIDGCTGSYSVTFTRTPNTQDAFYINLMVRNDRTPGSPFKNKAVENFKIHVGGVAYNVPASYFEYIMDSAWAILKHTPEVINYISSIISPGKEARIENSIARFHLGIANGGTSTGCKYGYFSDYSEVRGSVGIGGAYADQIKVLCNLDPVRIVANGGLYYKWYGESNPQDTNYLSSTTVAEPIFTPPDKGIYKFRVWVKRDCFADTNMYVTLYVFPGPIADFQVNNNIGCSPFTVQFVNTTGPNGVKFLWNFNSGTGNWIDQSALGGNPFSYQFPINNTDTIQNYIVTLIAYGVYNSCPSRKQMTIKVKPGVKAKFGVTPIEGCSPLMVSFSDSSAGHLTAESYFWDFGDNTQSFSKNPMKLYENFGNTTNIYNAKLRVTSPFGCVDSMTKNIKVHPYIKGQLSIDTSLSCSPMTLALKVNNSIGVDTFKWNIDYSDRVEKFETHNYNNVIISHTDTSLSSPDTIKIRLIAKNKQGCVDTLPERRIITIPLVTADFNSEPLVICDSTRVTFTNKSKGYKLRYNLEFGDGRIYSDTIFNTLYHVFYNRTNNVVQYKPKLTVISDNKCRNSKETTITVNPFVDANFAVDFETNCSPVDVRIRNLSIRPGVLIWDFGDGSPKSYTQDEYIYYKYINPLPDKDTVYILKLKAISPEGCVDSMQRNIPVYAHVVAAFDAAPTSGCNPLKVTIQNNSTGSNILYNWKFGDSWSSSETSKIFQRIFVNDKPYDSTFNITLTVTNLYGCDSTISKSFTIYANSKANFIVEKLDSCSPFPVRIKNLSSQGATWYEWDFGDGTPKSNLFEPSHIYTNTTQDFKIHPLRLVTRNNHFCYDTLIKNIIVYPEIHVNFAVDKTAGCQPLTLNFLSNTTNIINGTEFTWTFDDGQFSSKVLPEPHTYYNYTNNSIVRNLKLKAVSMYGCKDSLVKPITIYPYIFAKFSVSKSEICSDEVFTINRSASTGAINNYLWDFNNDGIIDATTTSPEFQHTYTNKTAASFDRTIKLKVTNAQGCDTSFTQTIRVHPPVKANFELNQYEVCSPNYSIIRNTSENRGVVAKKFLWDYGDGDFSNTTDEYHTHVFINNSYTLDKTYKIKLIAESDHRCKDSISREIVVHPKPRADFNFPAQVGCPPFTVNFNNFSLGTNLTYRWNFDDGSGEVYEAEPSHVFQNYNYDLLTRNVRLIATTEFGCKDTAVKPITIYPKVNVDFMASAWEGCSPLSVNFVGSAINQSEVMWYVNDVAFSTLYQPTYRFVNNTPYTKVYDIKFKATSLYRCTADTTKKVTVYPTPVVEFIPQPVLQRFDTLADITNVTFTNYTNHLGVAPWSYLWDFGDGTQSNNNEQNFVKGYKIWGDINKGFQIPISLTVWNTEHPECRDTNIQYITILPPIPQVEIFEDVAGCQPFTVTFKSKTKYNYPDIYVWNFGYNNLTSTEKEPTVTFKEPGVYIVKLTVQGDGGYNWDYKKVTVHSKPKIDFTFSPELVMVADQQRPATPVKFFNNTQLGEKYIWDFGDNSTSIIKEPEHIYNAPGKYYVTLIAESSEGCIDTMVHPKPVIVEGARYLEFPSAFIIDPSSPANEYYDPAQPDPRVFRPVANGVKTYRLEIYNKWGELIFVSEDVNKGWNGYINGKPAKQDVYVWRVKATFTDGSPLVKAGDVTLLIGPRH